MTSFFKDAGLDPKKASGPLQKTSNHSAFPDAWGEERPTNPYLRKNMSDHIEQILRDFPKQTFRRGDKVRHRASLNLTGTVEGQEGNDVLVNWGPLQQKHDSRVLENM